MLDELLETRRRHFGKAIGRCADRFGGGPRLALVEADEINDARVVVVPPIPPRPIGDEDAPAAVDVEVRDEPAFEELFAVNLERRAGGPRLVAIDNAFGPVRAVETVAVTGGEAGLLQPDRSSRTAGAEVLDAEDDFFGVVLEEVRVSV